MNVKIFIRICIVSVICFVLCIPSKTYASEFVGQDETMEVGEDVTEDVIEESVSGNDLVVPHGEELSNVLESEEIVTEVIVQYDEMFYKNMLYIIVFMLGVIILCQFFKR